MTKRFKSPKVTILQVCLQNIRKKSCTLYYFFLQQKSLARTLNFDVIVLIQKSRKKRWCKIFGVQYNSKYIRNMLLHRGRFLKIGILCNWYIRFWLWYFFAFFFLRQNTYLFFTWFLLIWPVLSLIVNENEFLHPNIFTNMRRNCGVAELNALAAAVFYFLFAANGFLTRSLHLNWKIAR